MYKYIFISKHHYFRENCILKLYLSKLFENYRGNRLNTSIMERGFGVRWQDCGGSRDTAL